MVIENADAPVKGQLMQYVLRGMSDGGYWTEAADLVESTVWCLSRCSRKPISPAILTVSFLR